MNIDDRLTRLEQRRRASAFEPLEGGFVTAVGHDGAVESCFYCPPVLRPYSGLAGLYAALEWRQRDTCPDAADCELASTCRADGEQSSS